MPVTMNATISGWRNCSANAPTSAATSSSAVTTW